MGNEPKITCTFSNIRFRSKPDQKEAVKVQFSLKPTDITIRDLADALVHGASFRPGVLHGRKKSDWQEQQLFGLDFDHDTTIEEKYNKAITLGIVPCFMYTTFSHTEEHHKFRMVFCNDTVIADGDLRDKLQATLMGIIGGIDEVCFNRDRLFYGGKGQVVLHPDYGSRINAETVIDKYWNEDFIRYMSSGKNKTQKIQHTQKKAAVPVKKNTNKSHNSEDKMVHTDNTDAIITLNIPLMQKRLGLSGDIMGTNKEGLLISVPTKSKTSINTTDFENDSGQNIQQFSSEAELYDYINSIDLQEYLGVPSGKF